MDRKYSKNKKAVAFLKRNVYYIIMLLCLIAIATMVTLTIINKNKEVPVVPVNNIEDPTDPTDPTNPTDPTDPTITDPIVFALPVANQNIIKDYAMDTLVWHSTLKQYSVNDGIDFGGNEGDCVCAVYDGVVESVTYDALNGNMVVIKHNDELRTIYHSLSEPNVAEGESVTKGQTIATMSTTATRELSDGPHVHFSVTVDEKIVSPYDYLEIGDK